MHEQIHHNALEPQNLEVQARHNDMQDGINISASINHILQDAASEEHEIALRCTPDSRKKLANKRQQKMTI